MFHLGGVNKHWEFFPAGSLFGQISDALDKSKSGTYAPRILEVLFTNRLLGQTFMSGTAYRLVKDKVKALNVDGDYLVSSIKDEVARRPWEPLVHPSI